MIVLKPHALHPRSPSPMLTVGLTALLIFGPALPPSPGNGALATPQAEGQVAAAVNAELNAQIIRLKNKVASDPTDGAARLALAQLYFQRGEPESAEKEIRAALSNGYTEGFLYSLLAESLLRQGQPERVIQGLLPEQTTGIDRARLQALRAEAYSMTGDLRRADREIDEALAATQEDGLVLIVASRLAQAEGRLSEALALAERAIAMPNVDARSRLHYAELLRVTGRTQDAVTLFSSLLEANALNRQALQGRTLAGIDLQRFPSARADAETLIEQHPDDTIGNFALAFILVQEERYEEADQALAAAKDATRFPPALFLEASLDLHFDRIEQARVRVDRYLAAVPESPQGLALRGALLLRTGEASQAVVVLEPLAEAFPEDARILSLLSTAYLQVGALDKAAGVTERLVLQEPDNAALQFRSAQIAIGTGELDAGLKSLEFLSREQGSLEAALLLVLTYLRNGDLAQASAATDRLERLLPNNPVTSNFRGSIALAEGNVGKAETFFKEALARDPGFTIGQLNLARIAADRGDFEAAQAGFEAVLAKDPREARALVGLARLADLQADTVQATNLLRRAEGDDPVAAKAVLTRYLVARGETADALSEARMLATAQPDNPAALALRAEAELAAGLAESVVITRQQIRRLNPDDPSAASGLAAAFAAIGEFDQAAQLADEALALAPKRLDFVRQRMDIEAERVGPQAALSFARALLARWGAEKPAAIEFARFAGQQGRLTEAYAALDGAGDPLSDRDLMLAAFEIERQAGLVRDAGTRLARWVRNNPQDGGAARLLFGHRLANGDLAGGIALGEGLLAQSPEDPVLLNNLAWAYGEQEAWDKAITTAEQARLIAPKSGTIADTLGWALYRSGAPSAALPHLQRAFREDPNDPAIAFRHAAALAATGQEETAVRQLERLLASPRTFQERTQAQALLSRLTER